MSIPTPLPEPLPRPSPEPLDDDSRGRADQILIARTKSNPNLQIVNARVAIDPDLKREPVFNFQKKLVLAEVLKLVADSLDPERRAHLDLASLNNMKRQLRAAVNVGVGQMLERLRPREVLVHQ